MFGGYNYGGDRVYTKPQNNGIYGWYDIKSKSAPKILSQFCGDYNIFNLELRTIISLQIFVLLQNSVFALRCFFLVLDDWFFSKEMSQSCFDRICSHRKKKIDCQNIDLIFLKLASFSSLQHVLCMWSNSNLQFVHRMFQNGNLIIRYYECSPASNAMCFTFMITWKCARSADASNTNWKHFSRVCNLNDKDQSSQTCDPNISDVRSTNRLLVSHIIMLATRTLNIFALCKNDTFKFLFRFLIHLFECGTSHLPCTHDE